MERFKPRAAVCMAVFMLPLLLLCCQPMLCSALSEDGMALLRVKELVEVDPFGSLGDWVVRGVEGKGTDPCSWSGVGCHNGRVSSLNLEDLCLKGTLSPDLGKLVHLRYFSLHNNSFYGLIPREIGELQKLEVLKLGYNNFHGSLLPLIDDLLSLEILVLSHNQKLTGLSPELIKSNVQVDDDLYSLNLKSITRNVGYKTIRRLLQVNLKADQTKSVPSTTSSVSRLSPTPPIQASIRSNPRANLSTVLSPPVSAPNYAPPPRTSPSPESSNHSQSISNSASRKKYTLIFIFVSVGAAVLVSVIVALYFRAKKDATVKPWITGLSGQLQKAFVTGVPVLKLSELQRACEEFSNVIGNLENCMIYKGTLSSGVEIAVISAAVKSFDWSKNSEAQFREKIATLSKVNHKNFVNLLGYCVEEKPFTRMMVFEYAPNGTLYDHLHIKEAKDLGWAARLRIAMGIAYCLEYMHQLEPPLILENLDSGSILLTDDYAAKISDIGLWSMARFAEVDPRNSGPLMNQTSDLKGVVYKYGLVLLEMISGRLSYTEETGELVNWASYYLNGEKPLKDMIDPMLDGLLDEDLSGICSIISSCIDPDPNLRPSMRDVAARLREVTSLDPDGATPKISPLWWAELEIISTQAS